MARGVLVIAIGAVAWLSGCGENCQTTCRHVYDPAECGIVVPGIDVRTMMEQCTSECEEALKHPGELRFDPSKTLASDDSWVLETDAEAAAWIDCVWDQAPEDGPSPACANIDPSQEGICAPI